MDTNKVGVVQLLDKDEVHFFDEDVEALLYEGVLVCLDKNNKDSFDVDFLISHPLGQLLEETLGVQCLVHRGYMKKTGWYDTYVHFCRHHSYKT